jgi:hypothetical protein
MIPNRRSAQQKVAGFSDKIMLQEQKIRARRLFKEKPSRSNWWQPARQNVLSPMPFVRNRKVAAQPCTSPDLASIRLLATVECLAVNA